MDLNADGHRDIVTGGYMGIPHWFKGGPEGFAQAAVLRDKKGKHMDTGRFWNPDEKDHVTGTEPAKGPAGRAYSALALDWDNDGDLDLVCGNDRGGLFLRENEGSAKKHAFATEAKSIPAANKPALVPGGYAMPVAADWDGDGLWDLVSGSKDGAVYWFPNRGKAGAPALEAPIQLVPNSEKEGLKRGSHSQVEVCDWDGDGDLDLLVGDCHLSYKDGEWDNHGYVWLYRRE